MSVPPLLERRDVIGVLARLDHRVVPLLQRGARAAVRGAAWPLRAVRRAEDRFVPRLVGWATRSWRLGVLVAVVIGVLGSAVHLQRYPDIRDARRAAELAAQEQTVRVPGGRPAGGGDLAGGAQMVGPEVGAELPGYLDERRQALTELPDEGTAVAVVSFTEYLDPDAIGGLLPDDLDVLLAQDRLPAEGEPPLETEVVAGDLAGSVDRAVEQAIAPILDEVDEVRTLLESGTIDDPAFQADLERRLSELQAVRNLVDSSHRVVFAVIVEGPVGALRTLAEHEDVRLVDPAPGETDPDASAFYGLLPEDRDVASFGGAS